MAHSPTGSTSRPGMPAPSTVVDEKMLVPQRPPTATPGATATPAPSYRILRTTQVDPYDAPVPAAAVPPFGAPRAAPPPGDAFGGKERRAAKLSIANAPTESFTDLKDLIESLTSDDDMLNHDPEITKDRDSDRVDEEKRNVRVRAFLYAASHEADNDFHLIIGRPPTSSEMYMTIEVSGLPPQGSASFARLKSARDAYKGFFGGDLPHTTYDFYDPPIPVEVEGSLFFDVSHGSDPNSHPGPGQLRPHIPTIWEVHPVTKISFEP
jgi:hypothetical protein